MKYNKVIIYYFSGTGNAENAAFWIANEAEKKKIKCEVQNIAKIKSSAISVKDENVLIGFISPTHGFNFPEIMRKFIKNFPKVKNCSAFIVNTRAGLRIGRFFIPGLSGVLHYWSSIILHFKGFKIVGLQAVDLPSNWISIHPALRKKSVELIYRHNEPKVRFFAAEILENKRSYKALYDIIQDTIISPIAILYILFGKYFFAKSFIASSDCNMCGLCEKTCPVQAIKRVDGRMFWTIKCESCMKCISNCPQQAIETAHGFIIVGSIVISAISTYIISLIFDSAIFVKCYFLQNDNFKFLLSTILFFPLLFAGYRIMHWLLRFRIIERVFVLSSFTNYKFWGRYRAPKGRYR